MTSRPTLGKARGNGKTVQFDRTKLRVSLSADFHVRPWRCIVEPIDPAIPPKGGKSTRAAHFDMPQVYINRPV